MGDMGEGFRVIREAKQAQRNKNFKANAARFEKEGWGSYTGTHWYKYINGNKVDYWPTSNKYYYLGVYYRGSLPKDLRILIHGE